jgi:hypothetical protein
LSECGASVETFQKALAGLTNKKMAAYLAGLKRIGCMTSLEAGMKVSKGKSGSETRSTLEQRMRAVFFAVRKARDRPIYWATETLSAVVHEPELGVELEGEWLEPELGDELEASDEEMKTSQLRQTIRRAVQLMILSASTTASWLCTTRQPVPIVCVYGRGR